MKTKTSSTALGDPSKVRNPTIFAAFLRVGKAQKAWAERTYKDKKWRKGASQMSLDMLEKYHSQTAEQIAAYAYDYWEYCAQQTYNPYGGSQVEYTDPHARSMWDALEKGDTSVLFKRYDCYFTKSAAKAKP